MNGDSANKGECAPVDLGQAEEPIMQWFVYGHLPMFLQDVSEPFANLASFIKQNLPRCAERTVALRKLLEAKDCAVRARLMKQ